MRIAKSVFICSPQQLSIDSDEIMQCISENSDYLIFAYALSSCFSIRDPKWQTFTCDQGTAYILSNTLNKIEIPPGKTSTILFILITRRSLLRINSNIDNLIRTKICECPALRILSSYANWLIKDIYALTNDLILQVESHFIDLAVAAISFHVKKSSSQNKLHGTSRLDLIKRDIANNLNCSELSVDFVAAHAGITPRYVRHLFNKDGISFTGYVLTQRLLRAYELLSNQLSARSITDIAFECGFNEISYFNRTFKRRFHKTPSEVAKQSVLTANNDK